MNPLSKETNREKKHNNLQKKKKEEGKAKVTRERKY